MPDLEADIRQMTKGLLKDQMGVLVKHFALCARMASRDAGKCRGFPNLRAELIGYRAGMMGAARAAANLRDSFSDGASKEGRP